MKIRLRSNKKVNTSTYCEGALISDVDFTFSIKISGHNNRRNNGES